MNNLVIGCHVSAAGGVFNAPKNAADLGCETFQIFSRPPQGGKAPELTEDIVNQFQSEMENYGYSYRYGNDGVPFVIHCPYFVNFGSIEPRIYHGSISVVSEELKRANLLGAKYVMTHLGSLKAEDQKTGIKKVKEGLVKVLTGYEGSSQFLLEIAAGAGSVLGATFEQLADLMEPLTKFKTFGGICFDTQHAFASGYDLRDIDVIKETFKKFDQIIGLKWLKMSHINDSKIDLASHKDRHDHIGEGKIGIDGFQAMLDFFSLKPKTYNLEPTFPLILETKHDKVKADIEILKKLRNKISK